VPKFKLQEEAVAVARLTFGDRSVDNPDERLNRFIEEAAEVAQAGLMPFERWVDLGAEVYKNQIGEFSQELAGAHFTLLTLAAARDHNLKELTRNELRRVFSNIPAIRAKAQLKPDIMFIERPLS